MSGFVIVFDADPGNHVAYSQRMLYSANMGGQGLHKEIRKALDEAEAVGLTVRPLSGHTWGWVVRSCGEHVKVFSTGRNPEQGAKLIRRFVVNHSDHAKEVER